MPATPLKKPHAPPVQDEQARKAFRQALAGRRTLAERVQRAGTPAPDLTGTPEIDGDPDVAAKRRAHPDADPAV